MKYKIALAYLDVTNIGDLIIYETARYILEKILTSNGIEYEIIPVDVGSFRNRGAWGDGDTFEGKIKKKKCDLWLKNPLIVKLFPDKSLDVLADKWSLTGAYKHYTRYEAKKLEGVDAIVFGGGGLIKYHQQNFHYFLNLVTEYADAHNIPVLINAQGIEGYDHSNIECRLLERAVNRKCVKYVSTRDDIQKLEGCFIKNPDITTKAVCDPAFWVPETYGVKKSETPSKKIGLNVIRTIIFGDYMYDVDENELAEVYYEMIKKLTKAGYQVELFANGVKRDFEFIELMLEKYPDMQEKYGVTIAYPKETKPFVELIAGYDRFMAARLHAAITGTVLGVPNISIVWNNKQTMFGEQVGMPENFLTKEDFNADTLTERLLNAKPYEMDWDYKMTVYSELERELLKVLKIEK